MRLVLPARSGDLPGGHGAAGAGQRGIADHTLRAPDTRARVVGYLATAPEVAPGWRTDGAFAWPTALAAAARDHGQAPPAELFGHMRQSWFLLPAVVPPELRTEAAARVAEAASCITGADGGTTVAAWEDQSHDARLARDREAEPPENGVRPARLFDATGPDRSGWFTPRRLRIPEADRRGRLATYLGRGRLVLRCAGRVVDPLDSRYRLPLGWRTDGDWVWPEALAHYVLTRGVAPELELLCHIERHGYVLSDVDDEVARSAAVVARRRPSPLRPYPPMRYLHDGAGWLARVWAATDSGGAKPCVDERVEVLRDDLRWGPAPTDAVTGALGLRPVDEVEAVAVLDGRWARADAVPALD